MSSMFRPSAFDKCPDCLLAIADSRAGRPGEHHEREVIHVKLTVPSLTTLSFTTIEFPRIQLSDEKDY